MAGLGEACGVGIGVGEGSGEGTPATITLSVLLHPAPLLHVNVYVPAEGRVKFLIWFGWLLLKGRLPFRMLILPPVRSELPFLEKQLTSTAWPDWTCITLPSIQGVSPCPDNLN